MGSTAATLRLGVFELEYCQLASSLRACQKHFYPGVDGERIFRSSQEQYLNNDSLERVSSGSLCYCYESFPCFGSLGTGLAFRAWRADFEEQVRISEDGSSASGVCDAHQSELTDDCR